METTFKYIYSKADPADPNKKDTPPNNPGKGKNDPFKKDTDNDPTRIKPGVHEPEKNDPTRIDEPSKTPQTEPGQPPPNMPPSQNISTKMKKIFFILFLCLNITSLSYGTIIKTNPDKISYAYNTETQEAKAQRLITRLNQIKEIDKSQLTGKEKRDLRKEVKEIDSQLKELSGGVYLSVGAIIIIILLLILLL